MKRFNKVMAVVFSLLLIFLMIPVLPGTAYADDAAAIKADPKSDPEVREPIQVLDLKTRKLERIIDRPEAEMSPEDRAPYQISEIQLSHSKPAGGTYLYASVLDTNDNYMDPNDVKVTWYYEESGYWYSIPEIPSDIGDHFISVPGYALGCRLKVVAEPNDSSVVGSATITTPKVTSSYLTEIIAYVTGTGYYVGNTLTPYGIYESNGEIYYLDDSYLWYDYYVGEGSSWTQIPFADENWYAYIPFEAEGKFIKIIAHTMADQDVVLGGPCTFMNEDRVWVLPIDDNFHDETLPSGWASLDRYETADGLGWESREGQYTLSLSGYDGRCIGSASYYYNPVLPDNWLISPSFTVPKHSTLEYYVTGTHSTDNAEHYAVYISDGVGFDLGTFTKLREETIHTYNNYEKKVIDLSAYAGKEVHIAFRHFDCTDQSWLNLDGVRIDSHLVRIAGRNRYDTALDLANRYRTLKNQRAKTEYVFVAAGDNFPDALSGSSISIAYDAPVLLISPNVKASQEKALNYIQNHVASGVVILGGPNAVPQEFEDRVIDIISDPSSSLSFVDRVYGADRYKTNLEILDRVFSHTFSDTLLVCDGTNYADAATASATGIPVMLVGKTGLTQEQKTFLSNKTKTDPLYIYVIGGTAAVSDEVLNQFVPYDYYGKPSRVYGQNRAETAVEVANTFVNKYNAEKAVLAYGFNFPDCIAGGLVAFTLGAPILYGDAAVNSAFFKADDPYFQTNDNLSMAYILGGKTLVSDDFALALLAKG